MYVVICFALFFPLLKDYPSEEQVEYDVYDASTDDGGDMSDDDGDDDGMFF